MSKKANRILAKFNDPKRRSRLLESLNKSTLDEGNPPVGNGEMTILKDMEGFDQEYDQHMEALKSGSHRD